MRKTKNTNDTMRNYGYRIFAVGETITNDTRKSGLNNNDLIIGTSGTGKTGGYVVPAIQNISGSLVVSDTKGLLIRRFRKELEDKGYKVVVLDFVNPMNSCRYNPFNFIRKMEDGTIREQDILTIADAIGAKGLDEREPIWDMSAKVYVAFLVGYIMEACPPWERNFVKLCDIRREFSQVNGNILFTDWIEAHKESFTARKYYEIMANRNAEKMWASIEGFVNCYFQPFDCREMHNLFDAGDSFDINDLGREKTVLFINQSDTDRAFDRVVNLLYTQILQTLCSQADANPDGRLKVPVRLIMDDFASGSTISDFDKIISVIRSREISVSLIIQSLTQLDSMYNNSAAHTIINNCDNILYLGSQDKDTAEYLAYRAGKTAETILSMPRTKAYLVRSGEKARLVDKIVPYSTVNDTYEGKEEEHEACK